MNARDMRKIAALLASFWMALVVLCLMAPLGLALADEPAASSSEATSSTEAASSSSAASAADDWSGEAADGHHHHRHRDDHGRDIVSIGHDAVLESGESADSVVSIGGEARSAGPTDEVVSVFGGTRVTGPVSGDAVAVLGDLYVDSAVGGDAVAVLGDVELGPHAVIGGDVTSVMGTVKRDASAIIKGHVESVGGEVGLSFDWLRSWMRHCALLARPLALDAGLGWAWTLALGFLALYVLLALVFPSGIEACVHTLEAQPGRTVLASFLMALLIPLALVLLAVTFIGLTAWPFVLAALFCASLFGKCAALAWIGHRVVGGRGAGALAHAATATLVGGVVVLILYLVPVVGFLVWNVLALLSLGIVATTLLARARAARGASPSVPPGAEAGGTPGPTAAAASTASMGAASGATAAAGPGPAPGMTEQENVMSGSASELGAAAAGGTYTVPPGGATAGTIPPGGASAGAGGAAPSHSHRVDPVTAATLPRAGFWIRMAALFIDVLLIAVLGSVLRHGHDGELHLVVLAIYGAIMWKLRGATVGDIVFDLQVARIDARPVDWETAIIRALGCFLSLIVAGLGFFWIAFDENRQAWHDKIAGTVVVRVRRPAPPAA